uniref:HAP1 N-terminal domain-containing protein n=1 Tax=Heterorhabditis bacteriophora TaxID=37862 RepID=A0A1I7X1U2_HETBA
MEIERLETECDVKEAQKSELETRIQDMGSRMEQAEDSRLISDLSEEISAITAVNTKLEEENRLLQSSIRLENERRIVAEHEMTLMREQLFQNANLLASPAFSRNGSMRQNGLMALLIPCFKFYYYFYFFRLMIRLTIVYGIGVSHV